MTGGWLPMPGGGGDVSVKKNGVVVGARPAINLVEGTNVTLTVADDAVGEAIDVTIDANPGGGSGAAWAQTVNQPGGSIASWTSLAGTWSIDAGGYIKQTATAAAYQGLKLTARQPVGAGLVVECEMRIPTDAAALTRAMIAPASSADLTGGVDGWFGLQLSNGAVTRIVQRETAATRSFGAATINTWHTIRVTVNGPWFTWSLDGADEVTEHVNGASGPTDHSALMLVSYAGAAHFRNIKAWRLDGPA